MGKNGKFALGALFGAAVGAVAGILTAPKSGKETRKDIKIKAEKAKKEAGAKVDQASKKGHDAVDKAKQKGQDIKQRSYNAFDSAKKEFDDDEKRK